MVTTEELGFTAGAAVPNEGTFGAVKDELAFVVTADALGFTAGAVVAIEDTFGEAVVDEVGAKVEGTVFEVGGGICSFAFSFSLN